MNMALNNQATFMVMLLGENPALSKNTIEKNEHERTLLLSLSYQLAGVSDIDCLKTIVQQFFKKLPQLSEYLITLKNEDGIHSYFLHDDKVNNPCSVYDFMINIDANCIISEAVIKSQDPLIFNIDHLYNVKTSYFPAATFWKSVGATKVAGISLKAANDILAILWVQPIVMNEMFLIGSLSLISIALSNAIARKKINLQSQEIEYYRERSVVEKGVVLGEDQKAINYEIIGVGSEIQKVYLLMSQVANTATTVLILGETGTGKELIARSLHLNSSRKKNIFIKMNCSALPMNLIESELFGHEKGSFTGAIDRKIGKFELANNGTLFLDEIGDMPFDLQVKFLRALQEREIERVGGNKPIKVNVRIIAATNRDLQKAVIDSKFRSDLYYRLNVFPIMMPPLRKRIEDIPLLVNHFIKKKARSCGKNELTISSKSLEEMAAYNWPGNIRELENIIERSMLLSTGNVIKYVQLPVDAKKIHITAEENIIDKTLEDNEREHIIRILKKCGGKVFGSGGAAEILDIPPSTLNSKLRKLKIKKRLSFNNLL